VLSENYVNAACYAVLYGRPSLLQNYFIILRVHGSFFAWSLQHEKRERPGGGVSLRIRRDFPSTAPMMWGLALHGIELEFADDSL
jgi:hypothetical protein